MGTLSVLGRAQDEHLLDFRVHDLRMTRTDPHKTVDDKPFGGGPGMVMKPEPFFEAVDLVDPPRPILLLDPGGARLDQAKVKELAELEGFTLLCGRYEGVDERVRTNLVDEEISIGDFVLAGGEFAAMVVTEAVLRLVPGVLGNEVSANEESFDDFLLEYPQWTRPSEFKGLVVPEILRSGNHVRVGDWRLAMAIARTAKLRPDLLKKRGITSEEMILLDEFQISIADSFFSD